MGISDIKTEIIDLNREINLLSIQIMKIKPIPFIKNKEIKDKQNLAIQYRNRLIKIDEEIIKSEVVNTDVSVQVLVETIRYDTKNNVLFSLRKMTLENLTEVQKTLDNLSQSIQFTITISIAVISIIVAVI